MKDPIFKTGDRVYHPYWGWGKIVKYEDGQYCIDHGGMAHYLQQDYAEKMYSFTKYDPVKAGLSHERPDFTRGDFVISDGDIIVVTGVNEEKAGYPCFSGAIIKSNSWPVGQYSKTWRNKAFTLIDPTLIKDLWKS